MSCTLFLCQEAKWTDINQPIVQSYAILLDWQIPTSHILTGHKFSRCHCCRCQDLVSASSLWVQSGGWVWVCAAASSLPDCFEAGCLGVYEVRPRGCSCPLSSAVQCQHPSASRTINVVPILAIQDPGLRHYIQADF